MHCKMVEKKNTKGRNEQKWCKLAIKFDNESIYAYVWTYAWCIQIGANNRVCSALKEGMVKLILRFEKRKQCTPLSQKQISD